MKLEIKSKNNTHYNSINYTAIKLKNKNISSEHATVKVKINSDYDLLRGYKTIICPMVYNKLYYSNNKIKYNFMTGAVTIINSGKYEALLGTNYLEVNFWYSHKIFSNMNNISKECYIMYFEDVND